MKKLSLALLFVLVVAVAHARFPHGTAIPAGLHGWQPLLVGGGGQVTSINISADGNCRAISTDAGGGYLWSSSQSQWVQTVNFGSMPAAYSGQNKFMNGTYALACSSSNSSHVYMVYGVYAGGTGPSTVFSSTNLGATWTATGFTPVQTNPNDGNKWWGPKLAVDPANENFVVVGTPSNGAFLTTDGGATWCAISSVPTSGNTVPNVVAFDSSAGTASSTLCGTTSVKTKNIFISSDGNGVYQSTNGGTSFTATTAGGPTGVGRAKVASDGVYYAATNDSGDTGTKLWRYQSAVWTNITPTLPDIATVVVNAGSPAAAGTIVAISIGGSQAISTTRGSAGSWTVQGGGNTYTSTDIPWLAYAKNTNQFLSLGDAVIDPTVANKIYATSGVGVWYSTTQATPQPYTSQTAGIEEVVTNQIISPPGGNVVIGSWDRDIFYINNPATYPTTCCTTLAYEIQMGWGIDWVAGTPSYISIMSNYNFGGAPSRVGSSTNGGTTDGTSTWSVFSGQPNLSGTYPGGSIASSTTTNTVYTMRNEGDMFNTKNGGTTVTKILASKFGATGMRNAVLENISAAASGTGGVIRFTVDSTSTAVTGDLVTVSNIVGTGAPWSTINFQNFTVTVVDSTHIELQGTTFAAGYTSGGLLQGACPSPGQSGTTCTGWGHAFFDNNQNVCADRNTTGVFYAYNYSPTAAGGGFYKSTDGGDNWVRQGNRVTTTTGNNDRLKCIPNLTGSVATTGHILYTAGQGDSSALYYDTTGGGALATVSGVGEVYDVGFGAVKPGNDYPSVYIIGVVGSTYGIWETDSSSSQWASSHTVALTWVQLGSSFPLNSLDKLTTISGDSNTYGVAYIGGGNTRMRYLP